MSAVLQLHVAFVAETCYRESCRISFAMPRDFYEARREDKESFFCPRGHGQHYTGKSEKQKLEDRLEREQQRTAFEKNRRLDAEHQAEYQKRRAAAYKGQITKARKRVGKGVCPCCNRTFSRLSRHMETKHPDYCKPAE